MLKSVVTLTCIVAAAVALAQAQSNFPPPNRILHDIKHKEKKSGVEFDGKSIIIHPGVGTPGTINALSFSQDGKLLAAGRDFGRIVVWDISTGKVVRAIDGPQSIVSAVAISPDHQFLASAGSEEHPVIALWNLATGKVERTFPVSKPVVQKLAFAADGTSLVVTENGIAYVIDTVSGNRVLDVPGERLPVLSIDAKTLITTNGQKFTVWDTENWAAVKSFPLPAKYAWPLTADIEQDLLIYGDSREKQSFIATRINSDVPILDKRHDILPQFNPSAGYFAAIAKSSHIVFGHSGGRLWGWNIDTGKTCISPLLFSESGQLSSDGSILVGAIDNGLLSKERVEPGVEVWDVPSLLQACNLN